MTTRYPLVLVGGRIKELPGGDVLGGISAGTDLGWFNVLDYGATGDGSTDDTMAIQATIDACGAAGGGTVYFPAGVYIVGGALRDTGRSNAQLLLPLVNAPATEAVTIVLQGATPPPPAMSVVGATPLYDGGAVIKGTLNTGSGTSPCLIGAHGPSGSVDDFSNIYVLVRDLTIQMPVNPALTALDLSKAAYCDVDRVLIHAGNLDLTTISLQTTTQSCGLRAPGINNGALTRLGVVAVVGFYNGYQIGEHCVAEDVSAWACRLAYVILANNHACNFRRLMAVWCKSGIVTTGADSYFSVDQFDIEHASSGTWTPTYDIDDGSNYGHGSVRWHVVLAGTGPDTTFLVNGGANLAYRRISKDYINGTPTAGRLAKWNDSQSLTDTTLSAFIDDEIGSTRGAILYRGASGWAIRAPGTSGTFLKSNGAGADPDYATAPSAVAYIPLVTGAEPPVLVSDGAGHLITVAYTP